MEFSDEQVDQDDVQPQPSAEGIAATKELYIRKFKKSLTDEEAKESLFHVSGIVWGFFQMRMDEDRESSEDTDEQKSAQFIQLMRQQAYEKHQAKSKTKRGRGCRLPRRTKSTAHRTTPGNDGIQTGKRGDHGTATTGVCCEPG